MGTIWFCCLTEWVNTIMYSLSYNFCGGLTQQLCLIQQLHQTTCVNMPYSGLFGLLIQQEMGTIWFCHSTKQSVTEWVNLCVLALQVMFLNLPALPSHKDSTGGSSMSCLWTFIPSMCSIVHSAVLGMTHQFHPVSWTFFCT